MYTDIFIYMYIHTQTQVNLGLTRVYKNSGHSTPIFRAGHDTSLISLQVEIEEDVGEGSGRGSEGSEGSGWQAERKRGKPDEVLAFVDVRGKVYSVRLKLRGLSSWADVSQALHEVHLSSILWVYIYICIYICVCVSVCA